MDSFFENVGGALQSLAKFFFVVGIPASVILGIVMFVNAGNASEMDYIGESMSGFYITLGIIILIGGIIMTVLFSFVLYAFGAIAEKYLSENDYSLGSNYFNKENYYARNQVDSQDFWECPKCGMRMPRTAKFCRTCGTVNNSSKIAGANEWKCPKCGKINQNYVGTCGCGELKPKL